MRRLQWAPLVPIGLLIAAVGLLVAHAGVHLATGHEDGLTCAINLDDYLRRRDPYVHWSMICAGAALVTAAVIMLVVQRRAVRWACALALATAVLVGGYGLMWAMTEHSGPFPHKCAEQPVSAPPAD